MQRISIRKQIDGGGTIVRGAAGHEVVTLKTLNSLNVYNMATSIQGSHHPHRTVQLQNLSSP